MENKQAHPYNSFTVIRFICLTRSEPAGDTSFLSHPVGTALAVEAANPRDHPSVAVCSPISTWNWAMFVTPDSEGCCKPLILIQLSCYSADRKLKFWHETNTVKITLISYINL